MCARFRWPFSDVCLSQTNLCGARDLLWNIGIFETDLGAALDYCVNILSSGYGTVYNNTLPCSLGACPYYYYFLKCIFLFVKHASHEIFKLKCKEDKTNAFVCFIICENVLPQKKIGINI